MAKIYLNRHLLMTHLPAQACKHFTSALPLLSPLIMVVGMDGRTRAVCEPSVLW